MHVSVRLALFGLASALPLAAQTACPTTTLTDGAKAVSAVRRSLHEQAVPEDDPVVPPAIATQLGQLKDALTRVADAALTCAPGSSSPEDIEKTLAEALHANVASAAETTTETRGKKDIGAYGSDLSVQVFQLFGKPKFFEVDFRYGIECGDDNLLLVYEATADTAQGSWQQRLRWDTPAYRTVADALGEFVMLTPLSGDYHHPTWHFVVAHGHPSCKELPRPTQFHLDLLKPTDNPAQPVVEWQYDHPYLQTKTTLPRLATTEDTVDFRIQSPDPQSIRTAKDTPKGEETYRFRWEGNGHMEPLPSTIPSNAPDGAQPSPATSSSPQ